MTGAAQWRTPGLDHFSDYECIWTPHAHTFPAGPVTCVHKEQSADVTPKNERLPAPILSPENTHRNTRFKEPHKNTPVSERMKAHLQMYTQERTWVGSAALTLEVDTAAGVAGYQAVS